MEKTHVWLNDIKDFVSQWHGGGKGNWVRVFWDSLMHAVVWGVWKERNRQLFEEKCIPKEEVIDSIMREMGNWLFVVKEY